MNELQAFEKHLRENEKSPAAIEKYLCDARAFLLDAEHRQEDHLLRFQAIQVAADGADSAGQSKGNTHRVQTAVPSLSIHPLLEAMTAGNCTALCSHGFRQKCGR